jgi:hypothetical protein
MEHQRNRGVRVQPSGSATWSFSTSIRRLPGLIYNNYEVTTRHTWWLQSIEERPLTRRFRKRDLRLLETLKLTAHLANEVSHYQARFRFIAWWRGMHRGTGEEKSEDRDQDCALNSHGV